MRCTSMPTSCMPFKQVVRGDLALVHVRAALRRSDALHRLLVGGDGRLQLQQCAGCTMRPLLSTQVAACSALAGQFGQGLEQGRHRIGCLRLRADAECGSRRKEQGIEDLHLCLSVQSCELSAQSQATPLTTAVPVMEVPLPLDRAFHDQAAGHLEADAAAAVRADAGERGGPQAAHVQRVARRVDAAVDHQRARRQHRAGRRDGAGAGDLDHAQALRAVGGEARAVTLRVGGPHRLDRHAERQVATRRRERAARNARPHRFLDRHAGGHGDGAAALLVRADEADQHRVDIGHTRRRAVGGAQRGLRCDGAAGRIASFLREDIPAP